MGDNTELDIDFNSPLFTQIFTTELMKQICNSTNSYFDLTKNNSKRSDRWKTFEIEHLNKFLAILLIMGIHRLPDMKDHLQQVIANSSF